MSKVRYYFILKDGKVRGAATLTVSQIRRLEGAGLAVRETAAPRG